MVPRLTQPHLTRYRIERLLGEGTGGTVYLARDLSLEREVALKVIRLSSPRIKDPAETRARFLREVKLTARLSHPNIIVVYDFGEEAETLFLAMEYVPGGTLAQRLAPGTVPFPIGERILLATELAEAMAHAHGKGILHRDLKPANILLTAEGAAKITDFGIGKLLAGDVDLTGSGEMIGSPAYMSPEQMRGERADTRSDIFGLGAVLYHLLSGQRPFTSDNLTGLVAQVQTEPLPDIFAVEPELPPEIGPILARCLAKEKEERYASAADLATDLHVLVPASAAADGAASSSGRRRRVSSTYRSPRNAPSSVGTETLPVPARPDALEPTRATGERLAQDLPTVRSRPPTRRAGHLATIAGVSAVLLAAVGLYLAVRTDDEGGLLRRVRRRAPTAPASPTPTPEPEPTPAFTPAPTPIPTAVVLLGSGPPVSATSRTLGDGVLKALPRRERLEVGEGLVLEVTPTNSRVLLDGRPAGAASDWDIRAGGAPLAFRKAGRHELRFTSVGRRDLVVEVTSGVKGVPSLVRLVEELPEGLRSSGGDAPANVPPPDLRTVGALRFDVEPPDALVSVDGRAVGPASRWKDADLSLSSPGVHEVKLTAKGRETVVLRVVASPLADVPRATVTRTLPAR